MTDTETMRFCNITHSINFSFSFLLLSRHGWSSPVFSSNHKDKSALEKYDLTLSELRVSGKEGTISVGVTAEHGHSGFTVLL